MWDIGSYLPLNAALTSHMAGLSHISPAKLKYITLAYSCLSSAKEAF